MSLSLTGPGHVLNVTKSNSHEMWECPPSQNQSTNNFPLHLWGSFCCPLISAKPVFFNNNIQAIVIGKRATIVLLSVRGGVSILGLLCPKHGQGFNPIPEHGSRTTPQRGGGEGGGKDKLFTKKQCLPTATL